MSVQRTKEQEAAISARGKVIVSASAGSGKTFVMIERLVSLILQGADVRKILAVTFTNKAAAQMRDRLRTALIRRIAEADEKERKRLKEQLSALPLAQISTIHAFSAKLIRTYFYLAQVDPAFEIISSDDAKGGSLSARALDEVFEEQYALGQEEFKELLAVYFYKKKDVKLRKIVTELYAAARGGADYQKELEAAGEGDNFEEACRYLTEEFLKRARFFAENAKSLGTELSESGEKGADLCSEIYEAANRLLGGSGLFEIAEEAKRGITLPRMPAANRFAGNAQKKYSHLKGLSAGIKELYKELQGYASEEEEFCRFQNGQKLSRALSKLILRYDEVYSRLKREADVLDYDDLEHFALKVLSDREVQSSVRDQYEYLFVDEYQDINPVQEEILSKIGGEEIFLVGDAKQSIYGFRGSKSEYFLKKEREFANALSLNENFRSSTAVLDAVNRVFTYAMTEESCGMDYRRSYMKGGARYGGHDGSVRFRLLGKEEKPNCERGVYSVLKEAQPPTDAQAEAIADLVEEEVGSDWFDADAGLMKKVVYGDIAILARKKSGDAEKIVAALSSRNIPVTSVAPVNVCDFWEARLLIDWLSYLDNPEQDIPLAGALLSRIGDFTESELVEIRRRFPALTFRKACEEYQKAYNDIISAKLNEFAKKSERYRALLCVRTAAQMANLLLSEGLAAEIAAKLDGTVRLRRVRRLLREGEGTVNEFLRRLKDASYRVEDTESGGRDAVKVLTMHSAKGLEFPVVILAGMNRSFHGPENGSVIYTQKFGFAPKSFDLNERTIQETVLRRASDIFLRREELKGELNLFYVAMTRAKFKLYLFFEEPEKPLSPLFAKCFADFIDFDLFKEEFFVPKKSDKPIPRRALSYPPDGDLLEKFLGAYRVPYPYFRSLNLPVKSSATELMQGMEQEERESVFGRSMKTGSGSAEEGTAYHIFLQNVRFGADAAEELIRMQKEGLLNAEQVKLLNLEELEKILHLPAIAALEGKRVYREQKFLIRVPAREVMDVESADEILLQGSIDLLCEDEKGFLILDYKYSSHSAEELKRVYAKQISIYRKAVSKVTHTAEGTIQAKIVNIKRMFEVKI